MTIKETINTIAQAASGTEVFETTVEYKGTEIEVVVYPEYREIELSVDSPFAKYYPACQSESREYKRMNELFAQRLAGSFSKSIVKGDNDELTIRYRV